MAAKTAGTWVVVDPIGVTSDLTAVDSTQAYPTGKRIKAYDNGATAYGYAEFIYLAGVASVVAKDVCVITGVNAVTRIAARAKGAVCLALGAVDASTKWGWFQVLGKGVANCDSTIAADAPLYIDGTTGRCDDTAVAGDLIAGMTAATSDDTNTLVVNMASYPHVDDADNA
jgi:hypothetical protein